MAPLGTSRRTPLGQAYLASAEACPLDGTAASGDRVHRLTHGAGATDIRLFDLTPCPRWGLKGRGSSAWLTTQGCPPPADINTAGPVDAGELDCLRLGTEDIVLLSRPGRPSGALGAIRTAWVREPDRPKGYDSFRDEVWAWFHIGGDGVSDLLAMTSPVDLSPQALAVNRIAQTRVAQMDCIVVRTDRTGQHGFDLFFDVASSEFMRASLMDLGSP